ncbi:hypothetical protein BDQ17DRAFT_751071 [Cyathus striatus]|nr:hypothetical protein BDQ17DRAFT_751071 [Cyathus striatus]
MLRGSVRCCGIVPNNGRTLLASLPSPFPHLPLPLLRLPLLPASPPSSPSPLQLPFSFLFIAPLTAHSECTTSTCSLSRCQTYPPNPSKLTSYYALFMDFSTLFYLFGTLLEETAHEVGAGRVRSNAALGLVGVAARAGKCESSLSYQHSLTIIFIYLGNIQVGVSHLSAYMQFFQVFYPSAPNCSCSCLLFPRESSSFSQSKATQVWSVLPQAPDPLPLRRPLLLLSVSLLPPSPSL